MGGIITIAVGILWLGVPFDPTLVDWPLLIVVSILGLGAVVAIAVFLAAICLQTRQESWSYPEAVAGALFLVSGVVFPLSVLPMPVQALGLVTPLTWWVEGVRHAVFPGGPSSIGGPGSLWTSLTGTPAPDPATIVLALLATGALVTLAATWVFRVSERRAKDRGLLDQTTGS
jgi:ABC-2 type transport system permease protein